MADIRNILIVDNKQGSTYVVHINNQERITDVPIIVDVGKEKSTNGLWVPWCDTPKAFLEGHRILIKLNKGHKSILYYMFQSGANLWYTIGEVWDTKQVLGGDYNKGKGEYVLKINKDGSVPVFSVSKL